MQKFGDVIRDTTLLSPRKAVENALLVNNAWHAMKGVDEELRKNIKIRQVKNNVLYLTTHNGIWAQEAQLRNMEFLKKINAFLKNKTPYTVKQIVIFVSNE